VLIRINQITRGWTNYFKHAIAKRTFSKLQHYTWWRIVRMRGPGTAGSGRTSVDGSPTPPAGGIPSARTGSNYSTPKRYLSVGTATGATRSPTLGSRLPEQAHGRNHGEPVAWKHARRVRRAAWKRTSSNAGTAPQADSTV